MGYKFSRSLCGKWSAKEIDSTIHRKRQQEEERESNIKNIFADRNFTKNVLSAVSLRIIIPGI